MSRTAEHEWHPVVLRALHVSRVTDLTPRMRRRVTLTGPSSDHSPETAGI